MQTIQIHTSQEIAEAMVTRISMLNTARLIHRNANNFGMSVQQYRALRPQITRLSLTGTGGDAELAKVVQAAMQRLP